MKEAVARKLLNDEQVERRKQDRTYSDLYGQTGTRARSPKKNSVISAQSNWASAEANSKGWNATGSAQQRKGQFLASETLDKPVRAAPGQKDD